MAMKELDERPSDLVNNSNEVGRRNEVRYAARAYIHHLPIPWMMKTLSSPTIGSSLN